MCPLRVLCSAEEPMSQTPIIHAQQIPHALRLSAAERLVASKGRRESAKRLVASAPTHGIDLDLMWGVIEQPPTSGLLKKPLRVRQVTLAVLGSGRTAMVFLSNPDTDTQAFGDVETQVDEIGASIKGALAGLQALAPDEVALAQTLIEPEHTWAHQACTDAGMICVGQLDYMRKPISQSAPIADTPSWPTGIEVRAVRTLDPGALDSDYLALIAALAGSYEQTLDCPELCGLRSMDDVVESHRATGEFDATRWHLIFKDGEPAGCCLLTHIPQSKSVELVYLGISPQARGLGLGRSVLSYAIDMLGPIGVSEVTCAVDNRNLPAIGIYESLGFERFDARVGFVSAIVAKS